MVLENDANTHAGIRTLSLLSDYENDGYSEVEIVEARKIDTIGNYALHHRLDQSGGTDGIIENVSDRVGQPRLSFD
ncbi:agmatinase 1 [Penicillium concentricum]|uniref:Agmatinase 1 n=1 Tax=Penicillium concentricum TaxID=293559 RepID=A0A9W9USW5_9EURO|nr:agmatinase 1 [Penicillium concentricum]KAJ5356127.1 agmatinase 1 [Penicillium concentricum]